MHTADDEKPSGTAYPAPETKALRVLHVTLTPGPSGGGVAAYLQQLTQYLDNLNVSSTIFGLQAPGELDHDRNDPRYIVLPAGKQRELELSARVQQKLTGLIASTDLIHIHGLRSRLANAACRIAKRQSIPIVISPHGQLHTWLMKQRRIRKRLLDFIWTDHWMRQCRWVHAMSEQESQHIKHLYPKVRTEVIPIGLDLSSTITPASRESLRSGLALQDKRWLLYFGTLDPRKGIDDLLLAWQGIKHRHPEWQLVVAGRDPSGRLASLQAEFNDESTIFLGEVDEEEKWGMLSEAELFVLPTHSEAFGIAMLEAMSVGTPVLTTKDAPWPELENKEAGWRIEKGAESLEETSAVILNLPDRDFERRGKNAQAWARSCFDGRTLAAKMKNAYASSVALKI
jgi:glycosyltransferase involved in cell wall biosynthesis